jgi:hypothetical protein
LVASLKKSLERLAELTFGRRRDVFERIDRLFWSKEIKHLLRPEQ